ncbi:MAG: 18S rRNA pseudouridine methyltransferase [Chaenotheca gracillima]|nr:MAG: 18S rRNA pseudouridine methyltransferase [Chaenotheca gracillima]
MAMADGRDASPTPSEQLAEDLENVPRKEDPFIQKYLAGREALITQEKKQRSDAAFRRALSPAALDASKIVSKIREEERRTIWTHEYEDNLVRQEGVEPYPGMMFTLARARMEKTRLWKIVRNMPKGALLHTHLDAMIDQDWLFEQALTTEGIHLSSPTPLCSASQLETSQFRFVFAKNPTPAKASIWTEAYEGGSLIPAAVAADGFPDGGRAGFLSWLTRRCAITSEESIQHHHGLDAIWARFQSTFRIIGSILFYEPIYRAAMARMFRQLLEDGVRWVDLRVAFVFEYRKTGSETPEEGYGEMIRVLGDELDRFRASEEGKKFWGARMIWTTIRRFDTEQVIRGESVLVPARCEQTADATTDMNNCIDVKIQYPHLIAGYDLVGQEDMGRPLKDLTPELFWFRKRCAEEGVEIPFFFHAGECLGDGDETDENLFDALLLGTRRIGHGFSLYKHPLLIDMVKEKRILVESCPISNEVLRLTSSVLSHPLPALLARGVSVALCNDDPTILGHGANGLTHDFWQALQGWDNLGLEGLGAIAENSVRWAAFEDQNAGDWLRDVKDASVGKGVRAERMRDWAMEWEKFCEWIVDEYGGEADT